MAQFIAELRRELAGAADPKKAPQRQAYMKSAMRYYGVSSPEAKKIFRRVLTPLEFKSAAEWKKAVSTLWDGARFREERYGAIHLCKTKNARAFQTPAALPLFENGALPSFASYPLRRRPIFLSFTLVLNPRSGLKSSFSTRPSVGHYARWLGGI